jgi:hypothetical protein
MRYAAAVGLAELLIQLAAEIESLDDAGAFPRSFSYLAERALEIAARDDAAEVRGFLEEPDLKEAVRAVAEGSAGDDAAATERSTSFLKLHKALVDDIRSRTPPPVSLGSPRIETSLRGERPRHTPPRGTIIVDDT